MDTHTVHCTQYTEYSTVKCCRTTFSLCDVEIESEWSRDRDTLTLTYQSLSHTHKQTDTDGDTHK